MPSTPINLIHSDLYLSTVPGSFVCFLHLADQKTWYPLRIDELMSEPSGELQPRKCHLSLKTYRKMLQSGPLT